MLQGFLKPAWKSKSIDKRQSAIIKMDESKPENQHIFADLATTDPSPIIKQECVKKLTIISTLYELSTSEIEELKTTASDRLSELGLKNKVSQSELDELLASKPESAPTILSITPFKEHCTQLLEHCTEAELAEVINKVNYAETRSLIADKINSLNALELARKNLKGKDKNAERIIRQKIDHLRAKKQSKDASQAEAETLVKEMQFITEHSQWRAEFKRRFEQLWQRWDNLEHSPQTHTQQLFNKFKELAQLNVDKQINSEIIQSEQIELLSKIEKYCHTLASLGMEELLDERLSINTILADAIRSWLELNQKQACEPSLSTRFLNAERALESLSNLLSEQTNNALKALKWPAHYPQLKASSQIEIHLREKQEAFESAQKSYHLNLDKLHKRLNRLVATTRQGDLKKARFELSAVTKLIEHYDGKDRAKLDDRLLKSQETVQKMEDWHVFATEPKLIQLCESMEALKNSTIHADKLAKKIAELQSKWKSLGHSQAAEEHWPRFKTAADLAYQPCATFFLKRKETQTLNLNKRERFVQELQKLVEHTDWDGEIDHQKIEHHLNNIESQWRGVNDIERKAGQKQWQRFKRLKSQVLDHLAPIYDANIALKQQLLTQTERLLSADLNDDSVNNLKFIQNKWKQIGPTRRKENQVLWKQFKANCDDIYNRISELRLQNRAEQDAQILAYKTSIKAISTAAKNANTIQQADACYEQCQQNYQALPELPKDLPEAILKRLHNELNKAQTQFSKDRNLIIRALEDAELQNLKVKAAMCAELELAYHTNQQADVSNLHAQLEQLPLAHNDWEKAILNRIKLADNKDKSQANLDRQRHCIELEIIKNLDSPDADKALRMSMQLERMKDNGFGGNAADTDALIKQLELDWYLLEGAEPTVQAQLQARFEKILKTKI